MPLETSDRRFKDNAYTAWATVTKALASPRRLEIADLLVQRPRTVEDLASAVQQPIANVSHHLQILRRGGLVETERRGTFIHYTLAPEVAEALVALRHLALERSDDLMGAVRRFHDREPETVPVSELQARLAAGTATLIDVRPADEFAVAHLPGAISVPIDTLHLRVSELPDHLLVATCRGPFCTYAARAVRLLREAGREAVRFELGPAEWTVSGGVLVPELAS